MVWQNEFSGFRITLLGCVFDSTQPDRQRRQGLSLRFAISKLACRTTPATILVRPYPTHGTMQHVYDILEDAARAEDQPGLERHPAATALATHEEDIVTNLTLPTQSLPPPPSMHEILKLARYICHSVEYCHRTDKGALGSQSIVFPLFVVRQCFLAQREAGRGGRESIWCDGIRNMKAPGCRFDVQIMDMGACASGWC